MGETAIAFLERTLTHQEQPLLKRRVCHLVCMYVCIGLVLTMCLGDPGSVKAHKEQPGADRRSRRG